MFQAHVSITGSVIGVGFRAWIKRHATLKNIRGWVQNVYNHPEMFGVMGGVEAVLQGNKKDVEDLIELMKKGPSGSTVQDVMVVWEKPDGKYTFFEVRV